MKKTRFYLLATLLLALSLMLAACGGSEPAPEPEPAPTEAPAEEEPAEEEPAEEEPAEEEAAEEEPAEEEPAEEEPAEEEPAEEEPAEEAAAGGEVTLWHAYGTSSAEEAALATLVENAQAEFPDLTINVLQLPFDQIFNRYSTEVSTGGGPDMFVAPNDDLGNWARSGIVKPLDDQLAGKLDNVEQVAIDGMMVDGQMYGVPESAKAVALYYNKSMVDAPPATTDELLALVEGGTSIVLNQNAYHSFPFFTAFGGQLMDANGVCIADQTGFTEAAEYLLALKDAGASFETDGGRADTLFRSGEVAMIVNGPWTLGDYRADLGDDLGVVSVPAGSAPAAALNGIDGFYLNPNSANPDAALDLALFLTNPESSAIYTADAGHVPIRTDVTADDELVQGFAAASAQGFPRPQSQEFGNYWGPFGDMITNVLEGVQEPAAAVTAACAAMNEANGKDAADAVIDAPAEAADSSGGEVMSDIAGEVSLWHAYGTSSSEEAALATLVENAQAAFPNLTINVLQLPFDQIFNRYSTEVATGGGPDMFVAPNDDLGNWARSGIVMSLDDQLAGKLDNVEQVAIDGMMVDGQMYGVPESAKAVALYYNKSMVDAAPATTDDLLALVEGGTSIVLNQNAYHSFPFFTAFGGQLMDANGVCIADQTGFTEAAEYLLALKDAGASFETDGGRADTLFRSGEVAMIVNGPWTLGDYRADLGDDLGVAPVPAGSTPAAALNGIDGFYLNPNSANQDAALELALFLTNPESSAIYTADAGHVPIRTDVTADDELVQGFAAASAQGFPRPQSEEFGNYWGPFGDMVTNVLEGVEEPAAAVEAACAAMNDANGKDAADAVIEESSDAGDSSSEVMADVSGEVSLWHAYGTSSSEEAALATLVENAQAAFPNLTINVLQLPFDQIFNRYSTEVATGGGPDMFVAPNDDLGNWARSGIVMPLDDQLAGKLDNVEQVAIDGMMVDGQMYGVPESAKAVALYYNKAMVDAPPATTDDLLALVEGGTSIVLNQNAYHSFPFFTAFGGQLMDDDGVCIADQTGFTEAAEYLLALKDAGASFETDGGRADTLFRSGEVAMIVNGPWTLGDYRADLGDDLAVAPVPAGSTPAAALNGIDGFYLNPNSANQDAALELALFLTNPESSAIYTADAGHVPIRTDVTADDELVQGFAAASAQGFPRPQSEEFGNYWGPFGDMVTNVLEGVEEPAAAVEAACAAMNDANGK